MIRILLLALFSLSLDSFCRENYYLLISRDEAFISQISEISDIVYDSGRTRAVKLKKPLSDIPSDIKVFLKPVKIGELYNAPADNISKKAFNKEISDLISTINLSTYKSYVENITYSGKRNTVGLDLSSDSGNRKAADFIWEKFSSFGYKTEKHCYKDRKADKECNIIARTKGNFENKRKIVIVGHFDSVGYQDAGADDNASGAAGVLELARVFSQYKTERELIFAAVNGEENSIAGTYALINRFKDTGDLGKIDFAVNMDMIAWNKDGIIEIETNKEFKSKAEEVASLAKTYTSLKPYIAMPAWGSDHVPFLEQGIFSYLSIEHWQDHNPCYHKSCDKIDSLNWNYALEILKLNAAVIAENK
ncbi:MAG: M28 family peptidase [Elusimicrobiota bacterium]